MGGPDGDGVELPSVFGPGVGTFWGTLGTG
jgi:hypothetical protein